MRALVSPQNRIVRSQSFEEGIARRSTKRRTLLALAAAGLIAAPLAEACITRIEITTTYRDLRRLFVARRGPGREARGQGLPRSQPHDRQNRDIVDIEFAPRNARGNVEYSFNFYILKPIDHAAGRLGGELGLLPDHRGAG